MIAADFPQTAPSLVTRIARALRAGGVEVGWADEIARAFAQYVLHYDPREDAPPHDVAVGMLLRRIDNPGAGRAAAFHAMLPAREAVPRLARLMVEAALEVGRA